MDFHHSFLNSFFVLSYLLLQLAVCSKEIAIWVDYRVICAEQLFNCRYILYDKQESIITSYESLIQLLDEEYHEQNVIIEIKVYNSLSQQQMLYLDSYLAPRPCWLLRQVPSIHIQDGTRSIVLQRLPANLLEASRIIADLNFPLNPMKNASCLQRPFHFNMMTGTWGNGLLNMQNTFNRYFGSIFVPYTTKSGDKKDRVFLADEGACPDILNKWECLFLPPTTCPWPEAMRECHRRECLPFSTSAAAEAEMKAELDKISRPRKPEISILGSFLMQSNSTDSYTEKSIVTLKKGIYGDHFLDSHFIFGVLLRYKTAFLSQLLEVERNFRSIEPVFDPSSKCVAVHMRRDDRALRGKDMIAWCKEHTARDSTGRLVPSGNWIDGIPLRNGQWMNMGCNKPMPFGAATLDHYLNASRLLLSANRNVFVMTDDPLWLQSEVDEYYQRRRSQLPAEERMNVFSLPIRPNHRSGTFNSSVDFWASINMARQCQAVVGHLGSAAFVVIYRVLCYFHDHTFAHCPPLFDISGA